LETRKVGESQRKKALNLMSGISENLNSELLRQFVTENARDASQDEFVRIRRAELERILALLQSLEPK
jgi:hypothetical protein